MDPAFAVHSALGPGLLESAYEVCLASEREQRRIPLSRQVALPVRYRGVHLDAGFRMDLIAGDRVVAEIKAVEKLLPVHEAQLLTYLKLPGHHVGLLINFDVALIEHGVRRVVRTA